MPAGVRGVEPPVNTHWGGMAAFSPCGDRRVYRRLRQPQAGCRRMRHSGFALLSRGRAVAWGMRHSWACGSSERPDDARCRVARIRVIGGRASPGRAITTRGCGPLQLGLCVPVAPRIARILRLILDFPPPFHEDREGRLASWRITALNPTPRCQFVFSAYRLWFRS